VSEGIVALGVCVCVCPPSRNSNEGNVLYPVLIIIISLAHANQLQLPRLYSAPEHVFMVEWRCIKYWIFTFTFLVDIFVVVTGVKYSLRSLQEFVKQARENSALYRQRLLEWEKKAIAQGHTELVRRLHVKKKSSAPRASAVKPKVKPAAKAGRPKSAATKPKTQVKTASTQTSGRSAGKAAVPKSAVSRKKKQTVEE